MNSPRILPVRPLLFVMNPRQIPSAMAAIEALRIDKVLLQNMWEKELEPHFEQLVEEHPEYTHFIWLADDTLPTPDALDLVLSGLAEGRSVVTGYCNLDATSPFVNLTKRPFANLERSAAEDYDWVRRDEIEGYAVVGGIASYFAGAALTGMTREMWRRFPFRVNTHDGEPRGYSSDWNLSVRLQREGIPIYAPRGAFIRHLKENWLRRDKNPEHRLLVDIEPRRVVWKLEQHRHAGM